MRAKNTIVILSNTTIAHFEVLFAVHLQKLYFVFFILFNTKRKKFGKTTLDYIISLEPIHVGKHFMTILLLLYLHLLRDI